MKVKGMLRGLLLAYGLTGIMLLLLAFLLSDQITKPIKSLELSL